MLITPTAAFHLHGEVKISHFYLSNPFGAAYNKSGN
jgi:hypothetical protein